MDPDEELFTPEPDAGAEHEAPEDQRDEAPEGDDGGQDDALEITIEGEEVPKGRGEDSDLVRKLRAEIRERDQRLRTYEQPKPVEVGPKPTLEACDWDEAKYDAALLDWNAAKAKADEEVRAARKHQEDANRAWSEELQAFERRKSELGVKDFDAVEETVVGTLSQIQQAVVIQAAKDPAKVVYALGRHPGKLAQLAGITNPVKLAVAVRDLEGQITVSNRRAPPAPETVTRGSAPHTSSADKHLEKLEREADRTGDRTAVVQYKRKLKEQEARGRR